MTLAKCEAYLCPKCNQPMVERPGGFFWRGLVWPGLICKICNSLWEDPRNPFVEGVARFYKEAKEKI